MTMSSIGLPTLNGFIGEVLILQGIFVVSKTWAFFAASGIVLGAAYMLWLYQRTMFGTVDNPKNENLPDLGLREFATFVPLLILAVWIGLYPKPFLDRLETSVDKVMMRVNADYTPRFALREAGDGAVTIEVEADSTPDDVRGELGIGMPAGFTFADFYYILPELLLTAGALIVLVGRHPVAEGATAPFWPRPWPRWRQRGGVVLAFAGVDTTVSAGLLAIDGFAAFFKSIFVLSAVLTVLMSVPYLRVEGVRAGEYCFLILCATLGMMFMASGIDLITLFIGLETMAISFYILAGFPEAEPAVERGGGEVLPAGRLLARHPAVRDVAALRCDRHHQPGWHRRVGRRFAARFAVAHRSPSSSWRRAWASRLPRCRSTCGRPTCMRDRRRRSPRSCRSDRRRRRSRC